MNLRRSRQVIEPLPTKVVTIGIPPLSELLSLGWQERTTQRAERGAVVVDTIPYRLLCHHRHRSRFYIQWGDEHGPIEPLHATSGGENKVTPVGYVRTNAPSGRYPSAPDDRVIPVDEYAGR